MTDYKALITEAREAGSGRASFGLFTRLADALEELLEVAAGADHTAAKYWRRMTEAEEDARKSREAGERILADALRLGRERDEALAVIERALENPLRMTAGVQAVLESVPADVLRDVKAQAWQEGAEDYAHWHGMPFDDQLRAENYERVRESIPYRETKEQDRHE